jgi:type 1 glutamine amidotransferase
MSRARRTLLALIALAAALVPPSRGDDEGGSTSPPHRETIASGRPPGIHVAGSSAEYHSANCGWLAIGDETVLIDLPRGLPVPGFLAMVGETAGKPARALVLTHFRNGDGRIVQALRERGVGRVIASPATRALLRAESAGLDPSFVEVGSGPAMIAVASRIVGEFRSMDGVAGRTGGVVYLTDRRTLFGGPLVVHGPRTPLPGSDTERWVDALRQLETLPIDHVVPGSGSWGGLDVLVRQRRFLAELRRQVGHQVAQGRPLSAVREQVRLPADCFAWMPYDTPLAEDLDHVHRELTVPIAPFHGREPAATDRRPHALVLIGDGPHEPGHIEDGLRPVFEATGVVPHFTVDVKALSAQNLAKVGLLVILRDGLQRPSSEDRDNFPWMTAEQERAVVAFVEAGGGFLNLHNSMGMYPPRGPYLDLVGGRYTTHGPLERFRVEVVDAGHPITRGVAGFFVADEQHTPIPDEKRVHILLRSRSDDGRTVAAAGWVREPGRGRLCHLAPGHTREALLHPMYQRLLRNAVGWCLRSEDGKATSSGHARRDEMSR